MITEKTLHIVDKVRIFQENALLKALQQPKAIALAKEGKTDFSIVALGDERVLEAARYLKSVLNQMVGRSIFDFEENAPEKAHRIYIQTRQTLEDVRDDGYHIAVEEENVYIGGICDGGTANGVYRFMEDVLGCMFVRCDYDYIPKTDTIYIDKLNITVNPDFVWRNLYQFEVEQNNWYKRLLSNGTNDTAWGSTCHTVFQYVDPKLYFKEHPEYFSLRFGKRVPDQLCLSNPDIYPIISKRANEMIAANPDALYWDFSINDNLHYCQCKNCRKLYRKYGKSGSILRILNRLAKEHPDKIMSTLAYTYNENPPRNLPLEKNINISLAPIKSGQKYSFLLRGSHKAKKTNRLITAWGKLCETLYIWDYIVNFQHTQLPYPNFDVQRDNLQFYKENNVKLVFHQGMRDKCCELAQIRSYVMARQLFTIDCDIDALLAKYLCVTYGKAAIFVAEYLEKENCLMKKKARDLDLYDETYLHRFDYLSKNAIRRYFELMDAAFEAESENPQILYRLEEIKLNVLYAKFTEISFDTVGKKKAFEEFKILAQKHGVDRVNEWNKPTLTDLFENGFKNRRFCRFF